MFLRLIILGSIFLVQVAYGDSLVHETSNLYEAEQLAAHNRKIINNRALGAMQEADLPLKKTPLVGIACSGGSCRAALATLGLLLGLEAVKLDKDERFSLLDVTTYLAGVSGATWTIAAWYAHECSLETFTEKLAEHLDRPVRQNIPHDKIAYVRTFKQEWQRSIGLNDRWGCCIGNIFLGKENTLVLRLSDLVPQASSGEKPIPILAAALGGTGYGEHYEWAEFTPFAVSCPYLRAWIDPDDFGKRFDNGQSQDPYPGERLSYILGLCSAFYAATICDFLHAVTTSIADTVGIKVPERWFGWLSRFKIGQKQLSPPQVFNFVINMPGHPLSDKEFLPFTDAGNAVNIPGEPLFRRGASVIIVCDASGNCSSTQTSPMKDLYAHAQKHGIKLPPVDFDELANSAFAVLVDEQDPSIPIIIYIQNLVSCPLRKFNFSKAESAKIIDSMMQNVIIHADHIKSAINQASERLA